MKTKILKVEEVLIDKECYPRQHPDFVTIARYMNAMNTGSVFPAITVAVLNGKNYLVDGLHRLQAMKSRKQTHIEAETIVCKDKKEIYIEAVKRNINHGHQFSTSDVVSIAITLENWNMSKEEISEIIRIPASNITGFVAKRAVLVTNANNLETEKSSVKKSMYHLAGTQQATEFVAEQKEIRSGNDALVLVNSLNTLIENGWIDLGNEELVKAMTLLYKQLGSITVLTPKVKAKKSKK